MIARHREAVEQNGGRMTLESCPLLPQTGAALQDMLQVVCYRRTYVPYQVIGGSLCLEYFIHPFGVPEGSCTRSLGAVFILNTSFIPWGSS